MQNKRVGKRIATLLFFLLSLAVIAITLMSEIRKGGPELLRLKNLHVRPALLLEALICFLAAVATESFKYHVLLKASGIKNIRLATETAVFGRYYDYITPSGIGGQPYQIFHLTHNGVDSSTSGAVTMAGFLSMQFGFAIVSIFSIIFGLGYIKQAGIQVATFIGLVCYLIMPSIVILFSTHPKFGVKAVSFFLRLLSKVKLAKNTDETINKLESVIGKYKEGFHYLIFQKKTFWFTILLGVAYHLFIFSLPYLVIHAFGGKIAWLTAFTTTSIIYTAITFIPTPGNSGAAEGSFYIIFSSILQIGTFWPMMVWRIYSYYSFIIAGWTIYLSKFIHARFKKRKL